MNERTHGTEHDTGRAQGDSAPSTEPTGQRYGERVSGGNEDAPGTTEPSREVAEETLRMLDPERIHTTGFNRDEHAVNPEDPNFAALIEDIRARGGNIVPIQVHHAPRSDDDASPWRLIAGHRRLEACRRCGIRVLAITTDDATSLSPLDRLRENLHRQDLSFYELAQQIQDLYVAGIVKDGQELADKLNFSKSKISRIWRLYELPDEFWKLFEDKRLVPAGRALEVKKSWEGNMEDLRQEAQRLIDNEQTAASRDDVRAVLDLLLTTEQSGKTSGSTTKDYPLSTQSGDKELQVRRAKGQVQVKLPSRIWTDDLENRLIEWLRSQPEAQQQPQTDSDDGEGDDEPSKEQVNQDAH